MVRDDQQLILTLLLAITDAGGLRCARHILLKIVVRKVHS